MDRLRRFKGRFVSEEQFNKRKAEIFRQIQEEKKYKSESNETDPTHIIKGRRIIDFEVITRFFNCNYCKEIISLTDIVKEVKTGLASVFHIQCRKCHTINIVPSCNHEGTNKTNGYIYDLNMDAVQGCINAGLDVQTIKKFLSIMNIPGGSEIFQLDDFLTLQTKEATDAKKQLEIQEPVQQEAQYNEKAIKQHLENEVSIELTLEDYEDITGVLDELVQHPTE